MKERGKLVRSTLAAGALAALLAAAPAVAGELDAALAGALATAPATEPVPVILTLAGRIAPGEAATRRAVAGRPALVAELRRAAATAQPAVVEQLRRLGVERPRSLWMINGLLFSATPELLREIARLPGVESVRLDRRIFAPAPAAVAAGPPEWGLAAIRAPETWALGATGAGVVVATVDSGVDASHQDLAGRWRGGANSWFDPFGQHALPHDAHGHGTQVMGLMVGGDAGGSAIGAAPGASWIAARIYDDAGAGTLGDVHLALQWTLDPDGNPATDDAPAVVNNSWGFDLQPGQCVTEFEADVATLKAAGIAVVFSAGNAGPAAGTSLSPANNTGGFSIGAVTESLVVASFSSRGPSACGTALFPRLAAPGVDLRTADLTGGGAIPGSYVGVSGTSFSAPLVAGGMALLAGAFPAATVAQLEQALEATASDLGTAGDDAASGHGLPDLLAAHQFLAGTPACADGDADGWFGADGCGTALDCDDGEPAVHPGAAEVPRDGIDQDCNGYDLTIAILKAEYKPCCRTLVVRATSARGRRAGLSLAGHGRMNWNPLKRRWQLTVKPVRPNPGTVLVKGSEGAVSAPTVVR